MMLHKSASELPQTSFFDVFSQLNQKDPLMALGQSINWSELESAFAPLYRDKGRGAKPIRLMCGLLMLKQLYDLSDESVVQQWKQNPYYQVFCGERSFQNRAPCHTA